MGLLSVIVTLMAGIGFLTFGFTEAVCRTLPTRIRGVPGSLGQCFKHDPITTVGTWLEIVPHCPSITSTSIALALSPEPLVQLSLVQASRLVYALQYS